MAVSNSYNYTDSFTAANVINRALMKLGVRDADETIDSTEETNALAVLNLIVKEWAADGADIWLRDTMNLVLTSKSKNTYFTDADYFMFGLNVTQLNGAAAATATTIVVDNVSNISSGYYIFIKLADNTIHATTVNGSPSGSTVTLTTALPS